MKRYPITHTFICKLLGLALAVSLALPLSSIAATVALATSPLANSTTSSVAPNLMFMLDDSGSMDWDYMPDNAKNFSGKYGFNSNQCNGTYYNPSIIYSAPVKSDGTSYPNSVFTAAQPDGYNTGTGDNLNTDFTGGSGSGSSGISLTPGPAFYYVYSGTLTNDAQKDYYNSSSAFYQECNSAIGSSPNNTKFTKHTLSSTETTTISVIGNGTATITITAASSYRAGGIVVSGGIGQIMSGRSSSSSSTSTVAQNIRDKINDCTTTKTGSCDLAGFSATVSGSVITISGPAAAGATLTISDNSGSWTKTTTAFSASTSTSASVSVGGSVIGTAAASTNPATLATNLAASINTTTGYTSTASGNIITVTGPATVENLTPVITTVPASGGITFSAGTFPETTPSKLQNFANWYTYYSNRMLMMKTGVGLAFLPITDKYRVGFMTMNNNVNPDIVDIAAFTGGCLAGSGTCQKDKWYTKLYGANPGNSTPLREALAKVGRLYAGKFSGSTIYTATIAVSGSASTSVSSITVNGVEIMDTATTSSSTNSTVASRISGSINAPLVSDFSASTSGSTVTITGPASASGFTPVITQSGSMTFTVTSFSAHTVGANLNGITPNDPVQYSCQQNFIMLSTDGYWNGNAGYKLDGTTAVGNQDGLAARAMYDGGSVSKTTTQTRETRTQTMQSTSQIQRRVQQEQQRTQQLQQSSAVTQQLTGQLYTRTSSNSGSSWTNWASTSTCTEDSSGSSRRQCMVGALETRTSSNSGSTWTSWAGTASCTTDSSGSSQRQCQVTQSWTTVASCTPTHTGSSGSYAWTGNASAVDCQTSTSWVNVSTCTGTCQTTDTGWVNVSACTPSSASGQTITCQTTDTGWVGASSCTASGPTVGQTVTCQGPITTGPTAVTSCTDSIATSSNNWTLTSCATSTISGPTLVSSCTADTASSSNGYVTTSCSPTSTTSAAATCTPQTASPANGWTTITCSSTGGTSDTLSDVAMYYYETDLRDASLGNCTGAASTDFPSGNTDVCTNNVFVSGVDNNVKQHMTAFTLGLGARGKMVFSPDYATTTSGDFYSVKTGQTATAGPPVICSWQSSGPCNWPIPSSGATENIDDLWHAAIDGRGNYFSATDPKSLSDGLGNALSSITARKGSAAAAATSTLNPVPGNNLAYLASYTTVKWTGNLEARSINVDTGAISTADTWCAENTAATTCLAPGSIVIDNSGSSTVYNCVTPDNTGTSCSGTWNSVANTCSVQVPPSCTGTMPGRVSATSDTRTIYTASSDSSATPALVDFVYANLNPADFDAAHINSFSQWSSLTATQKTAAEGANLVNFLRGQNGYEDRAANLVGTVDNRIYRYREAVMGDVLESQPFFIGPPVFGYTDTGYGSFVSSNTSRLGTVYVGANDGMLHAFAAKDDSTTSPVEVGGKERWAYVPSMLVTNMWKLADKGYDTKHTNFINGSVNIADVYCPTDCAGGTGTGTAQWRTILVGGLNAGGRGYYALDITDPTAPILLWEFTSTKAWPNGTPNLGYSYGNPVITKLTNGTWVVLVTSGYNNVSPGDGKGHLYVLNAMTGTAIRSILTNTGNTTTPSGLSRIATWNDVPASNQAGFTYGGDLLGNVWRFDVNSNTSPGVNPMLFATLFSDTAGTQPQPVTTIPVLGLIEGKRVVFIGTGKYLEQGDLSTTQVQSEYAMMDDNETTTFINPRNTLVQQTLSPIPASTTPTRTELATNPVNFSTDRGWFVDFPDSGERVNIDSSLILGTLLVPTLVPSNTACSPGGYGWFNYFNYKTGGVTQNPDYFGSGIVGYNITYEHGKASLSTILSTGDINTCVGPDCNMFSGGQGSGVSGTRSIWRELLQ